MDRILFGLIGGFLGAGKTTAMTAIGRRLADDGRRVALVTNDQADDLVDTGTIDRAGLPVVEVAGGCFCCRFGDFVRQCDEILAATGPHVLLAEPVGSCADLSATVLQPLKKLYPERYQVLPYTVLCDPHRLAELRSPQAAESPVGYLFYKQLEEADILVVSKADTLAEPARRAVQSELAARLPATDVRCFSATTGEGIDAWWSAVLAGPRVGQRLLDIDYDTYAEAEAAMGWLNATVDLTAPAAFDAPELARAMLLDMRHELFRQVAEIGHIKLLLTSGEQTHRANLTRVVAPVEESGDRWEPVHRAELTFNARVVVGPELLEDLFLRALRRVCNHRGVTPEIKRLTSLKPGRPTPEHRFAEVVG